jgi:FkbM family methyltransferase
MERTVTPSPKPDLYARLLGATGRFAAKRDGVISKVALRAFLKAPGRELEFRDEFGHLQLVDSSDLMGAIWLLGKHRMADHAAARVKVGDWVLDLGANIGIISSHLASIVGPTGSVWAVEPLPTNVERLTRMKERNALQQLTVVPVAVGAEAGTVSLGLPAGGHGSGWGSITKSFGIGERCDVPVQTVDALVAGEQGSGRRLTFVKLDVEGYEFEVLEGAGGALGEHKPVVYCEFNGTLLEDRGRSSNDLLDAFADIGYQPAASSKADAANLGTRVVDVLLEPV